MGKIVIMYGLPAAGKTTQAKKIAEKYGLYHFIMSDKLRELAASGSETGQKIKEMMASGALVPDEIIVEALRDVKPNASSTGIVFDGFPRLLNQNGFLEEILGEINLEVDAMILLKVPGETAEKRISDRVAVENRVDDKDKEAVKNRMNIFMKESIPLSEHYLAKEKFYELDGEEEVEIIFEKICQIIEK
jgi:adenylate kinase